MEERKTASEPAPQIISVSIPTPDDSALNDAVCAVEKVHHPPSIASYYPK